MPRRGKSMKPAKEGTDKPKTKHQPPLKGLKKPTKTWARLVAENNGGSAGFKKMVAKFVMDLGNMMFEGSDLSKSYAKLSTTTHPDKITGNTEKQQALTSAYDFLKGYIKRTDINTHIHTHPHTHTVLPLVTATHTQIPLGPSRPSRAKVGT